MTEEILTKLIINCETGEKTYVPLTVDEIAERELEIKEYQERKAIEEAEAQVKAEAKASALAKLEALGLTEEEAAALIS